MDARGAVGVLTEAALPPVVVGQAVVALGPRGTFFAFTVAGLVAAVVQGADLVAVTFWPKTAPSGLVLPAGFVPADPSPWRCWGLWERLVMCYGRALGEPAWPRGWEGMAA